MAVQQTQTKNKVFYRNNILFLLANSYQLKDFTSTVLNDDFGEKKQITYHFRNELGDSIDITEYNLFNIDLQTNSTFRNKYNLKG